MSMTPTSILVPIDGSPLGDRAIDLAVRIAHADGARLVLFRAVPEGTLGEVEAALDGARAEVEALAARHAAASGLVVEGRVGHGDPARAILAAAEEAGAGLIVLSTHGRTGVRRALRGSVAEAVLRDAPVPVLAATPAALEAGRPLRRIVVAHDGSDASRTVLPAVLRLARAFDAQVALLRVEPYRMQPLPSPLVVPVWDKKLVERSLAVDRDLAEAAGVSVEVEAVYGPLVGEILRAAEDADLVALTTHGRSGPSRWVMGSVAEEVLRRCPRPVLVARRAED